MNSKALLALLIVLLCCSTIVSSRQKWHRCTPESREGEFCPEYYTDTCGYRPNRRIRFKAYGNPCFACHDRTVKGYYLGKCPK